MSTEFKGGYRTEVARYELIPAERVLFEKHIETHDLVHLAGKIERGEPHEVNPNYGGKGYTYLYPEAGDLGRVKVKFIDNKWNLEWDNSRAGHPQEYVLEQKNKQESRSGESREHYAKDIPRQITRTMLRK